MNRLREIDILRGFAIFVMIIANYSPYFIDQPPIFLRLVYTFAAPLFVSITGFLMYRNKIEKDYGWQYFFVRGLILVLVASLLDLIGYRIYPFLSFDVLYLIGFCTMIFIFLYRLWNVLGIGLMFIVFIITIILQFYFGYNQIPVEYPVGSVVSLELFFNICVRQFLIDGYFPVFPWAGIFVLGFVFFNENHRKWIVNFYVYWLILFVIFSYVLVHSQKYIRDGYGELFYPPDYVFILWVLSFIFLCFSLIFVNIFNDKNVFSNLGLFGRYLELIGKSSLFFYLFHLFLVEYFWSNVSIDRWVFHTNNPYVDLMFSYVTTLILFGFISLFFEKIKQKKLPFLVRFFIGS
ncbi:MAG: heparan-alpha-glucosaminide N-acetyltransferase domain-containing protein [Candidatus Calescibacterium sp.]|nr:DUF1624 domain-containing protein [Candidatus Calescibacterium sp.]MDW8132322.1 heparan-alpha-glucosaminide N-acetyltransferase domain-containing protein [Candidatus Calescibacterium sp.]